MTMVKDRAFEAAELDEEILGWIARGLSDPLDDTVFDGLAVRLFHHQRAHSDFLSEVWGRWATDPDRVLTWRDIPPIPHTSFKHGWTATFPESEASVLYRTSGTTNGGRGSHGMNTASLYREASLATFRYFMLPDEADVEIHALVPSPAIAKDSSLSAMVGFVMESMSSSGGSYWIENGELDDEGLVQALRDAEEKGRGVMLLGTSFSFVHLCDRMGRRGESLSLPAGSRIMETGGFKGRSREVSRSELLEMLSARLGVPSNRIVNEYGMTELSSQLYTSPLLDGRQDLWLAPPWVRVRALDPSTRLDVPAGDVGVLAIIDLANRGSAVSVLTADLGQVHSDGTVRVLGRAVGASPRGCSWALDAALGGGHSLPERPLSSPSVDTRLPSRTTLESQGVAIRENRSPREVAAALGAVSERWMNPEDTYRNEAIEAVHAEMGFSRAVIAAGIDASFSQWDEESLAGLLEGELGAPVGFGAGPKSPEGVLVIAAGNVPTPVAFDVICALLVGSAVVVKPPTDAPSFARIFVRSIEAVDPLLASFVHVVEWKGGESALLPEVLRAVDVVLANGSDETMDALMEHLPPRVRFIPHGTRISLGALSKEILLSEELPAVAKAAAQDIALWDQRGCLSPMVWLVEEEAMGEADVFASLLSDALVEIENSLPSGRLPINASAAVMALKEEAVVREVAGAGVRVFERAIVERKSPVVQPYVGRTALIFPVSDLAEASNLLRGWEGRVSTITLAGTPSGLAGNQAALAPLGATRYCVPGEAQRPPASWHHDGMAVLRSLVQF